MTMAEDEINALREALCNQLLIVKRLYTELEEEREASASGAEEALSMILRLQKEKAEEKMEACQYKRMAEAEMHHAKESLAFLKEVMFQKEIELASLKYQVQAYKHVLLSIGVNNPDAGETKVFDNRRFSRSTAFLEKATSIGTIRRQISLPSIRFNKLCSEMDIIDGDGSLLPTLQSIWRGIGDYQNQLKEHRRQLLSQESVIEECNSDSEQVQEVNTSVEELLQTKSFEQKVGSKSISANNQFQMKMTVDPRSSEEESRSCSWYSAVSGDMLSSSCLEAESIGNTFQSVGIQGIFEVPKSHNGYVLSESSKKVLQEAVLEAKEMIGRPDAMPQEAVDHFLGDDDFSKKALNLSTLRKGASMNYCSAVVESKVGNAPFQTDVEQLKSRMQQLEDDIRIMKKEDLKKCKEQLKLLREIHERLDTVQSHIKNSKSNKHSPQDEALFVSLTEAMLSFSI